jgi:hypothetical protein
MPASPFPHLNLIIKARGDAKLEGGGEADKRVNANKANRPRHSDFLTEKITALASWAETARRERAQAGLPEIKGGVPFVIQIPEEHDGTIEFLAEKLGLEIVAEYDDGFLIVANDDISFSKVTDYINNFAASKHGATGMASILNIDPDPLSHERIQKVVIDDELLAKWPFQDAEEFILDVSIEVAAFGFPTKKRLGPKPKPEAKALREATFLADNVKLLERWETKRMDREAEIEELVKRNNGEICSITDDSHIVEFPDSFSVRIRMNGQGFKDLIKNYPNVFEVTIPDEVTQPTGQQDNSAEIPSAFQLLPPDSESPAVCVIDSGIQEGHKWLEAAMDKTLSRCFIPGKDAKDVADYVNGGGHGTSVAGACLYPQAVPTDGTYKPPFKLLNARVLDENNGMTNRIFPAELMREIVVYYKAATGARIYQHSVASKYPYRTSRMSVWAAAIDLLSYDDDILVIQAAGNLERSCPAPTRPGVLEHLRQKRTYPDYLREPSSRLCNPAQSLQALTVGSISGAVFSESDRKSLADTNHASAFSRTGFGLWESIKPEVVEFGGDFIVDQGNPPSLAVGPEVCPELIRSTRGGGPPYSRDKVGTSFAAPKVAHIAGHLAALFPDQGTLLYRALIVNSARWPVWVEHEPVNQRPKIIRSIGYGVPDLSRATENTSNRVTLITDQIYKIKAKEGYVFGVPIPVALRPQGETFRVRVDVTLSYAAQPRRTRKSRRGYLGVWLDWRTSKKRESFKTFRSRALKKLDDGDGVEDGNFSWVLGNKKERDGVTDGVSRRSGTVQKDWMIADSSDLPETFGIVVRGHEGWDR